MNLRKMIFWKSITPRPKPLMFDFNPPLPPCSLEFEVPSGWGTSPIGRASSGLGAPHTRSAHGNQLEENKENIEH